MSYAPLDPSGGSDLLQVIPQRLRNSAPFFSKASQDTFEHQLDLDLLTQQLMADMFLISELSRFAQALQHYYDRLSASMHCLANELGKTSVALINAANEFESTDNAISKTFQPQPNIPGWLIPTPLIPFVPRPGLTPPKTTPLSPLIGNSSLLNESGYLQFNTSNMNPIEHFGNTYQPLNPLMGNTSLLHSFNNSSSFNLTNGFTFPGTINLTDTTIG